MAFESEALEDALLEFEDSDFGGVLTCGTAEYPCSPGTVGVGGRFVAGGISPNAEVTVVVRKSLLPADFVFGVGDQVGLTDGFGTQRNLKVADEGVRDLIFAWELTLDDANQRA